MQRPVVFCFLALLLPASLLVTGCGLFNAEDGLPTGSRWVLKAIENANGEVILRPDADFEYWIRLGTDSTATGMNACNRCAGGWYETGSSEVAIGLLCTEMGCGEKRIYMDYASDLCRVASYEFAGNKLLLHSFDRDSTKQTLVHAPF